MRILPGFGGAPSPPKAEPPPPPPPPVPLPEPDDEATRVAKRKRAAETRSQAGRASTILTDTETLGGS